MKVNILKIKFLLLIFLIVFNIIGNAATNLASLSKDSQEFKIKYDEPEVVFIEYNTPYDFLYADGIYADGDGLIRYEQSNYDNFVWDDFSLDFDFYTSKIREQWPIILGTSTRSLGLLLKDNRTIEITSNNQRQTHVTQAIYQTNKWYHAKIVKKGSKTEIYLNDIKIGEFQIYLDEDTKDSYQKCASSVNYSNGICFDGLLRNIIYTTKGDLEFSKKIYQKYATKYSNENIILAQTDKVFHTSNAYNLYSLNWKSFKVQFDYTYINHDTQLILGDKWKVINFHTINDNASISINSNRTSYITPLKLELNQKYKIEILINNSVLQMLIDDKIVLNTPFEYSNINILEREKEILVISEIENPSDIFENLIIENNILLKNIKASSLFITKQNKVIDTINEGVLDALFIPPFEFKIDGSNNIDEFAFKKHILGFNINSFQMDFDFLTDKKQSQDLIALGVYTKYSEIDLSIENDKLVFKIYNKKSTIIPINASTIKKSWNKCKIVYDKGLVKIYLNDIKIFEVIYKFSDQYYKSKLLSIRNTFVGTIKNLYVYESAK